MRPFSSTWIISVFINICSLQIVQFVANLAMITALKCSGLSHAKTSGTVFPNTDLPAGE